MRASLDDIDFAGYHQEKSVSRIAFAEQFLAGRDSPGLDNGGDGVELRAAKRAAQRHSSQCGGVFFCHR
jgi:hypothetical protein